MEELNKSVSEMVERVEVKIVRPEEKKAYYKMAECFDDSSTRRITRESINACLERSGKPVQRMSEVINRELNGLQKKINLCSETCKDDTENKFAYGQNFNAKEAESFFNDCTTKCAKKHVDLLASIEKKIESDLTKLRPDSY